MDGEIDSVKKIFKDRSIRLLIFVFILYYRMILDLFQSLLSNRQSVWMYILNQFLRPHDQRGLYGSCSFFKSLLTEKCPLCRSSLEPRKKIAFFRAILHPRIDRLPPSPCGKKACDHRIYGHYIRLKRYSLCLFFKKFDPKRLRSWEDYLQNAIEDEYQYQKAYRRSGYSIQMSRMSF